MLSPLGGHASIGPAGSPAKELVVALAGSLTHVVLLGVWTTILLISSGGMRHNWGATLRPPWPEWWLALCLLACRLEVVMLCFNLLLPAWPLDGGRIFANLLLLCRVPVRVAGIIVASVACVISTGIVIYGIFKVVQGKAMGMLTIAVRLKGCYDWDGKARSTRVY